MHTHARAHGRTSFATNHRRFVDSIFGGGVTEKTMSYPAINELYNPTNNKLVHKTEVPNRSTELQKFAEFSRKFMTRVTKIV
jgi:hypothetical protein